MPLYEYQCGACGHRLEALQKMSDDRLVICPACNEPSLKKLISAAAFHLKGTGWYETDFKNSGKKDDSKKSADKASEGSSSDGSDNGKSEKTSESAKSEKASEPAKSGSSSDSSTKPGTTKDSASSSGSNAST